MDRHAVALVLEDIAALLDDGGQNRFRARAFRTAARAVEKTDRDLRTLVAAGELESLPGVGPGTARVIEELVVTGESAYHATLKGRTPSGLRELVKVPGLGPSKIARLHEELGVTDLATLEAAARSGAISSVRGFGERTQQRILDALGFVRGLAGRRRYHQAEETALRVAAFFEALDGVQRAVIAGDIRRGFEIVDGAVIVVAARAGSAGDVARRMRSAAGVTWETQHRGADAPHRLEGRFGDGFTLRVQVVDPERMPAALLYHTGAAGHVQHLEAHAANAGLCLDAAGLRRGGELLELHSEEALYDALGLQYVPPELRDGTDEVELAARGALPELVELRQLQGCFHCHTTWSDGTASVAEMAEGAIALGWRYLGIADHSQNAGYAGGLSPAQLKRQRGEVNAWNQRRGNDCHVFQGVEADILADGNLDYATSDPAVLDALDYVIGSVHSNFRMPRDAMTGRMTRAVADPRITMLGHARGRLLLTREGYDVDIDAVIHAAADAGTAIEINADPHRLDMSWEHWPLARNLGVRTAINPDAHSVRGMRNVRYGVMIARRGRLRRADVINAWDLPDVRHYLEARKRGGRA